MPHRAFGNGMQCLLFDKPRLVQDGACHSCLDTGGMTSSLPTCGS